MFAGLPVCQCALMNPDAIAALPRTECCMQHCSGWWMYENVHSNHKLLHVSHPLVARQASIALSRDSAASALESLQQQHAAAAALLAHHLRL
jgi:hypothetical protein